MMSWHLVIVAHDWPPIAINNNGAGEMRAPSIKHGLYEPFPSLPFPSLAYTPFFARP